MSKKFSVPLVVLTIVVALVISVIIMMGIQTSPPGTFQKLLLGNFRDCIWYGFEGDKIFDESHEEKTEIVLPDSLAFYTPLKLRLGLKELKSFNQDCDLIYNPKGYNDNTWIIIYNSNDFNSKLSGNYSLWSDKEIRQKRGLMKGLDRFDGLKYYDIVE